MQYSGARNFTFGSLRTKIRLAMAAPLIGREGELLASEGFLERSRRGPAGLVIAGEPGIGKTVLWRACLERVHDERSGRVLSCRAAEAEVTLSFAALSDLLGGAL